MNVLVAAFLDSHPHHGLARSRLDGCWAAQKPFALAEIILAAAVRILTNPRIFADPVSPLEAFQATDKLRTYPGARLLAPGGEHWHIFRELVLSTRLRGGDVSDAYFAALAIEHGAEWWTLDQGFARFPSLKWRNLLKDP